MYSGSGTLPRDLAALPPFLLRTFSRNCPRTIPFYSDTRDVHRKGPQSVSSMQKRGNGRDITIDGAGTIVGLLWRRR